MDWHVYPLHDLREHITEGGGVCWCKPTEDEEQPGLWVHHAFDQREKYETGELKPQ